MATEILNAPFFLASENKSADFEAKYLQLQKLGEGGFGSVYAGLSKMDGLPIAIKHIPRADVHCLKTVRNGMKFKIPTEVLLHLKVAGPDVVGKTPVVSLLDWFDVENEVILIMERPVPAVDLLAYMENNNGPLTEDTCKVIMKQLVEAAMQIHANGVFHRDIKLENILIHSTVDGPRVRVIDFGCGCLSRTSPFYKFAGTFAYAPPEFSLYGRYSDSPTTVWQLGAALFEMTDGYNQFETATVLREGIEFNKNLSNECQDLLHMCLAVNPDNRISLEDILLHHWFR